MRRKGGLRRLIQEFLVTDPIALLAVAALVTLGELNLLAIGEPALAVHQLLAVGLGAAFLVAAQRMRAGSLPWLGRFIYVTAVLLLIAVDAGGSRAYGAQRWLTVGSLVLQPSELAKLGLLLVLADALGVRKLGRGRVVLALALAVAPLALTLIQPDLSTTGLLLVVLIAALFLGRVPARTIAGLAVAAAAAAPLVLRSLHGYQLARLHSFVGGAADPRGAGYSSLQAHIAIGSGGFFGIVHAPIHSLLAQYLPARQTDLAFASLVEQWGLIAGAAALAAATLLIWRLVRTARLSSDPVAALVAGGLAVLFAAEVAISVAGNLGRSPLAGVPFPFISYGGTAAAAHLAALGLVLGARRQARRHLLRNVVAARRVRPRMVRLTGVSLASMLMTLGCMAYQDQQLVGATYAGYGISQMTRCAVLPAPRGVIEDRHGAPLAVDDPGRHVVVVPALLLRDPAQIPTLAAALGQPPGGLMAQLTAQSRAVTLDVGLVAPAVAAKVDALELPGVVSIPSQRRHYPTGALMGPILGFTGVITAEDLPAWKGYPPGSVIGRAGLERQYDAVLRGRDGYLCVFVNPSSTPVAVSSLELPEEGSTLRLSIDLDLQRKATDALQRTLDHGVPGQPRADLAAAVVLDARNGQVLAMASVPSYDNNIFGPPIDLAALEAAMSAPGSPMLEHATQVAVPPGSTFKLVVASADTVFNAIPPASVIPTGYTYTMGTSTFHGWGYLPPQNLSQAIAWSNDVYFYKLGVALGPERMAEVAAKLGVGRRSGIDLPGEAGGLLGTPTLMDQLGESWYPATTAFMGIGQGYLTATPLQVADWTSAVATGRLATPSLALGERAPLSAAYQEVPRPAAADLDFAGGLAPVRQGLRLAVTEGTATMLNDIHNLNMGGKTGSAEDPSTVGGTDAWFTCVGPMETPEVVTTVIFRGGGEGHMTAEPVGSDIVHWYAAHRAQVLAGPELEKAVPPVGEGLGS
ncbi:MAG TPA: FtsW/RodA/SpoVE family cell cycle protein [Candidatus Dormibacteraeota bacterium]